jgi:hypothetical protein
MDARRPWCWALVVCLVAVAVQAGATTWARGQVKCPLCGTANEFWDVMSYDSHRERQGDAGPGEGVASPVSSPADHPPGAPMRPTPGRVKIAEVEFLLPYASLMGHFSLPP